MPDVIVRTCARCGKSYEEVAPAVPPTLCPECEAALQQLALEAGK